jgi:hypothetical protein
MSHITKSYERGNRCARIAPHLLDPGSYTLQACPSRRQAISTNTKLWRCDLRPMHRLSALFCAAFPLRLDAARVAAAVIAEIGP